MRSKMLAILAGLLFWSAAFAEDHSSYQVLWNSVSQSPDCARKDFLDYTIFTCEKQMALWYFTKPNHPAHPGVIKRSVVEDANGVNAHDEGWSFASDAAQPAFRTFLAQISALDEEAREAMAAQHGVPSPTQSVRVGGNWQPQDGDNQTVVAFTMRYFSLEDAGKYDDAYTLLDQGLAAMEPFAQYQSLSEKAVTSVGHVKTRTLKTIDWENDQPGGPKGLYAALDYAAETERGELCGYVAWRRQPDGFYVLVREETNIIPSSIQSEQAASLRAQFHCVK